MGKSHVGILLERGPLLIACSRNPALRASFDTVPYGTGAIGYRGNRLSSQEHGVDLARQCESGTQAQHGLLCCILIAAPLSLRSMLAAFARRSGASVPYWS